MRSAYTSAREKAALFSVCNIWPGGIGANEGAILTIHPAYGNQSKLFRNNTRKYNPKSL
jgi:hypothetical protein